jgi:transposase-like protein
MSQDIVDSSVEERAMALADYLVAAVLIEGRPVADVAREHGVSRSWLYELLARYREHGGVSDLLCKGVGLIVEPGASRRGRRDDDQRH